MRVITSAALLVTLCGGTNAQEPDLAAVLAHAGRYASDYEQRFSLLVAEELYQQETRREVPSGGGNLTRENPGGGFRGAGGRDERRVLKSDYLLVRLGAGGGWMPFRDVFEVNGRKVHDRDDRLANLFLKPSATSFDQAGRIMQDSTRHNLGTVQRTINIPTLAVLFVQPGLAARFQFEREGLEPIAGRQAWRVAYREVTRPTLIRTNRGQPGGDQDLPLLGKLWIDPATGTILKTSLVAADAHVRSSVTVTFREDAQLQFWVPAQMDEVYRAANDEHDITGLATYSNYRRFQVNTAEALGKPPG